MSSRLVLVTGATGNQGRAVTESLLAKGHRVRALTRTPDGGSVVQLKEKGVEILTGDYDTPDSIERAVSGVDSVFAVTTPAVGADAEVRHGKVIADAANAAGVSHLVFSSVANADRQTHIPHFDSKYQIEQHIRTLEVPWTVVAPVFFFDNVLSPWNVADLAEGRFRQALPPTLKLRQISAQDLGRFNAHGIDRRDQFLQHRIDIAADELTGPEMAAVLSTTIGHPIEFIEQPLEEVRAQSSDTAAMYEWFDQVGFTADIEALRLDFPSVEWTSFEQWATSQDWGSRLAASADS